MTHYQSTLGKLTRIMSQVSAAQYANTTRLKSLVWRAIQINEFLCKMLGNFQLIHNKADIFDLLTLILFDMLQGMYVK